MAPPLILAAVVHMTITHTTPRKIATRVAAALGVGVAVCGWYYLRNWIELGKPFVGGWDPSRGFAWWQDPGYRTWSHLTSFGTALHRPIFAATHGWWDALYSTMWLDGLNSATIKGSGAAPWNINSMTATAVLSLAPAGLICAGLWRAVVSRTAQPQTALLFGAACIGTYIAVMFDLYVRLPIYSTGKATYMIGLLPCFSILAAAGFEPLHESRIARAVMSALLVCWAAAVYVSYWAQAGR
jgi:hypothetical protein